MFRGSPARRAALTSAAAGLAIAAAVVAPTAQAAPAATAAPAGAATAAQSALADRLTAQLGARAAGAYVDAAGAVVVNVTDAAAAATVRTSGATARLVAHSATQLAAVQRAFATARVVGTSVAIDARANQVVVSVSDSVSAAGAATVRSLAARLGSAVRVERTAGALTPLLSGGQAIYGGSSRCSAGFNARNSSATVYYVVTAGHCTNIATYWYTNSSHTTLIGARAGTSFPGNDYGIIRYDNTSLSHPGNVYLYNGSYQDITGAGNAYVGEYACRSGSTTGVHCGSVTATNATVYYSQGAVYGLIKTNICAEPGDSGGSLYSGSTALGTTSGGSGNCTYGGTTYFQPVTEPLAVYGLSVY